MENFTIAQLVAFLMVSYRQSHFKAVEDILTAREADLKKQQAEDLEELRSLWRVLESKFADELAHLETHRNSLQSDIEASRKEAIEKSESFAKTMDALRKKIDDDAKTTRYLKRDVEDTKKRCAALEKERKEKSEMYGASLRNLQKAYEEHTAAVTTSLCMQRDFLVKELDAYRSRCTSLEQESKWYEETMANDRRVKCMKRCEELETRLSLLEEVEKWNLLESGSNGKEPATAPYSGKSAAVVITGSSSKGEGSARAKEMRRTG